MDNNSNEQTVLTLEKFKPFDSVLIETADQYKGMVIVGIDDKTGYESVCNAITTLTKLRTGIEKTRIEIKAPALTFGKRVDLEAKRLTDLISVTENTLRKERQRIDTIIQQKREEAERIEMELFTRRTDALFAAGFVYDGVNYAAGDLKILAEGVTTLTDSKFDECIRLGSEYVANEKAAKLAAKLAEDERFRIERQLAADAEKAAQAEKDAQKTTVIEDPVDTYLAGTNPPIEKIPDFKFPTENEINQSIDFLGRTLDRMVPGRLIDRTNWLPLATDPPEVVSQKMYKAGFEDCREKILLILARPDKFTRDQLRGLIQGIA